MSCEIGLVRWGLVGSYKMALVVVDAMRQTKHIRLWP